MFEMGHLRLAQQHEGNKKRAADETSEEAAGPDNLFHGNIFSVKELFKDGVHLEARAHTFG